MTPGILASFNALSVDVTSIVLLFISVPLIQVPNFESWSWIVKVDRASRFVLVFRKGLRTAYR